MYFHNVSYRLGLVCGCCLKFERAQNFTVYSNKVFSDFFIIFVNDVVSFFGGKQRSHAIKNEILFSGVFKLLQYIFQTLILTFIIRF